MADNAKGIRAGRAYVEMGLNTTALAKGLSKASDQVKAWGAGIRSIGTTIGAAGVALTAPFIGAAKVFADTGSAFEDMSARTGVSVRALSLFGYAASQTGAELRDVEKAIRRMQRGIVDGATGGDEAAESFEALGLSARALIRLTPEQQFLAVARAIAKIEDPTRKAAAAMSIFGKNQTAIIPMIDDLDALTAEAKAFGLVMYKDDVAAADKLGDTMGLLGATLKQVAFVIGSALAPLLTEVAYSLAVAARNAISFVRENRPLIVSAFKVGVAITAAGAALVALGVAVVGIGFALGTLATVVTAIATTFTALFSPIGIAISLIVLATGTMLKFSGAGADAVAVLTRAFASLKTTVTDVFGGIATAIKGGDIRLAVEILWAGIKVVWYQGIVWLKTATADLTTAIPIAFVTMKTRIASVLTDSLAGWRIGFVQAIVYIQNAFTDFMAFMEKGFNQISKVARTAWATVQAFAPGGGGVLQLLLDADTIERDTNKANEDVDRRSRLLKAVRGGRVRRETGKIEAERTAAQAALEDAKRAEIARLREASAAGIAGSKEDLAKAEADLAALLEKVGAGVEGGAAKRAGGLLDEFDSDGIGEGLKEAASKVDVAGSFNAAAFRGLGIGETRNDQLKEQKKATDQLERLNRKADLGRLVFARS